MFSEKRISEFHRRYKATPTGCWEWTGNLNHKKGGRMTEDQIYPLIFALCIGYLLGLASFLLPQFFFRGAKCRGRKLYGPPSQGSF